MLGLLKSAYTVIQLYLMRRRQFDNQALRKLFASRYGIEVGLYSYGCFDRWRMPAPMRVGRYCSIASTVRSAPANHPLDAISTHPALYERSFGVVDDDHAQHRMLIIEDDVWIGHNAMILPSCRLIGRGAVIGAGAVVTKDVEAYSVVAGNPARKLRDRFDPDLAAAIERSRWWELDLAQLKAAVRESPETIFHPTAATVSKWRGDTVT
jgi:virginiamycin A acetyltransferase